ncbi:hypothetical protein ACJX0J_037606, partial [Zea mays]
MILHSNTVELVVKELVTSVLQISSITFIIYIMQHHFLIVGFELGWLIREGFYDMFGLYINIFMEGDNEGFLNEILTSSFTLDELSSILGSYQGHSKIIAKVLTSRIGMKAYDKWGVGETRVHTIQILWQGKPHQEYLFT